MSEYPDHLNPFKEKKKLSRSLTESFRGIKGFIRKSIRMKKPKSIKSEEFEDVIIRKQQDSVLYNTPRSHVMSLPSPGDYSDFAMSPPLPRSRFKERLSRTHSSNTFNCMYDERCNPFAEEGSNPFDEPPVPYRRKRSKKRVPLPTSTSDQNLSMGMKGRNSSKWSVTSSETDIDSTFDDKSENSIDIMHSQTLRECLNNFNEEMGQLNKETSDIDESFQNGIEETNFKQTENIAQSKESIESTHLDEINNNEISVNDENCENHIEKEEDGGNDQIAHSNVQIDTETNCDETKKENDEIEELEQETIEDSEN